MSAFTKWLWFVVLCVASCIAKAEGFDTFGDHQKLADQTIVASGNISSFYFGSGSLGTLPLFGSQKAAVYQVGQFCFASSEDNSGKAGLLLVDQNSSVSVATFSTNISSIKVNIFNVAILDCVQLLKRASENIQQDFNDRQAQREIELNKMKAIVEALKKQQGSLKNSQ
ncbi:MAG: hypothetical protein WC742_15145 [Gallionellaceae bacterium]|jgi:arginine decarboxylase-like protein